MEFLFSVIPPLWLLWWRAEGVLMAKRKGRMGSSFDSFLAEQGILDRRALDRLLDPNNTSVTLHTLQRDAINSPFEGHSPPLPDDSRHGR